MSDYEAEARCAQRLKEAREALALAAGAAGAAGYGDQLLMALDEAIKSVEYVQGMLA
jgi:hypothetical protein